MACQAWIMNRHGCLWFPKNIFIGLRIKYIPLTHQHPSKAREGADASDSRNFIGRKVRGTRTFWQGNFDVRAFDQCRFSLDLSCSLLLLLVSLSCSGAFECLRERARVAAFAHLFPLSCPLAPPSLLRPGSSPAGVRAVWFGSRSRSSCFCAVLGFSLNFVHGDVRRAGESGARAQRPR